MIMSAIEKRVMCSYILEEVRKETHAGLRTFSCWNVSYWGLCIASNCLDNMAAVRKV